MGPCLSANRLWLGIAFSALLAAMVGCQQGSPSSNLSINTKAAPVATIAAIAKTAQECWFKSREPAFRDLRMSNEVNSFSGRPRFLLVKRSDPNGLPQLVVQAETKGDTATGKYTNVQTFGPLLQTSQGKRITDDVARWTRNNTDCKPS